MHTRRMLFGTVLLLACGGSDGASGGSGEGSGSGGSEASGVGSASAVPTTGATGDTNATGGTGDVSGETTDNATGSGSESTGSPPLPFECGAFTPGDDLTVCTATYLGATSN